MSTKKEILQAVERLQNLLRAFPRNGNDTAILAQLGEYAYLESGRNVGRKTPQMGVSRDTIRGTKRDTEAQKWQ